MSDILFNPSSLPISHQLHALLSSTLATKLANDDQLATCPSLVFNFRDQSYSAESGGFHPVEIAISRTTEKCWDVEYITDFAYVGNVYPELERCLDFDFQSQSFYAQYCGYSPIKDNPSAIELYQLWESNFLSYTDMGAYDDISITPQ